METGETANAKRPHVRYLDGLRGVAILAVLLIHSEQLIHGLSQPARDLAFYGVRGVQLFFIVSGLTLTMNYVGRPFHLVNFAARRFFRIAPMFYAGILLYLLLNWLTEMPLPTDSATPLDVAATILFLHGWLPSAINTVVPGGWSIAAEAMFYVAFPALLWAARTRRRADDQRRCGEDERRQQRQPPEADERSALHEQRRRRQGIAERVPRKSGERMAATPFGEADRDGQDEEYVVCALLHDIGDTLGSFNHPDIAAAILKPFVSEENHWMVAQHSVF